MTELPLLKKRDIRYALQMLLGWRDALPISYKPSPEHNHGYKPRCAYADTLPDTGAEPIDASLMREELRNAFAAAFVPLTATERELFADVNGVDTRTFETLPQVSKIDLSLKYGYADESGINKAEGVLHYKIVGELSAIRYTDSVGGTDFTAGWVREKEEHSILQIFSTMRSGRRCNLGRYFEK